MLKVEKKEGRKSLEEMTHEELLEHAKKQEEFVKTKLQDLTTNMIKAKEKIREYEKAIIAQALQMSKQAAIPPDKD
jgi:4-aminobutyrate aminotransferase-like enzyme